MTVPGMPKTKLQDPAAAPVSGPAAPVPGPPAWPVAPPQRRRPPLGENLRHVLAATFVAAYVSCVLVEPAPNGLDP